MKNFFSGLMSALQNLVRKAICQHHNLSAAPQKSNPASINVERAEAKILELSELAEIEKYSEKRGA